MDKIVLPNISAILTKCKHCNILFQYCAMCNNRPIQANIGPILLCYYVKISYKSENCLKITA